MDNFISLRRLRNWIVTASVVTLLSSLVFVTPVWGQYFDDVPEDEWYAPYVNNLADLDIVEGENGLYSPARNMNRAEIAKVATLAAGIEPVPCTEKPFDDVPVE